MSEQSATNTESSSTGTTVTGSNAAPATSTGATLPSLGEKWYEGLPEDIRDEPSLRTIHDIAALSKSYVHARKAIGADKVVLPSKHATEDDWKKFWTKVGHPEKLDDYKVEPPKDIKINEDFFKSAKEQLHKLGILPKSANELINWYANKEKEFMTKSADVKKTTTDQWTNSLKQEWGNAFDKNVGDAKRAINHINDPELKKVLEESGLGNHPAVVKAFNKLGQLLIEDGVLQPSGGNQKTPKDAEKEINQIYGNREHPFHNAVHPGHKAAVSEMQELFKQLYPEPEQS